MNAVPKIKRTTAANSLAAAQEQLQETAEHLKALMARRREALLNGTDDQVAKVDAEIEVATRLQRTRADRVSVLIEEAEKEAVARRAREHAAQIGRVEAKIAERSAAAAELAKYVKLADDAFVRVCALNRTIRAAWGWQNEHVGAILAGDGDVALALAHELFRVAGRIPPGGGQPNPHPAPSFPGARPERMEWMAVPEKSATPLTEKFSAASDAASVIMRTGRNGPTPVTNDITAAVELANTRPAANGDAKPVEPAPMSIPQPGTPELAELSRLLARQSAIADMKQPSESDSLEYTSNGARIRELQQ